MRFLVALAVLAGGLAIAAFLGWLFLLVNNSWGCMASVSLGGVCVIDSVLLTVLGSAGLTVAGTAVLTFFGILTQR